jgi:hypothetical protein
MVLYAVVVACLLNIVLVGILAGTGVLKTAERGDIKYTDTQIGKESNIIVSDDVAQRFAIERPTDADAFYNAVVRVRSGGPLYNTWQPDNVQEFHYLPVTFYFFAGLSAFGYVVFKFLLFGLSVAATILGTYLLLQAELPVVGVESSPKLSAALAVTSAGFAPMVANFKIGQVTPLAYVAVAFAWWAYRRSNHGYGGAAIAVPTLLKPYWAAPVAVFASTTDRRWNGLLGFGLTLAAGNALSVLTFGLDTTVQYYAIIIGTLLRESGGAVPIAEWSVEAIRPFWFLGEFGTVARVLTAVPVLWVWMRHARRGDGPEAPMFALTVVMLFTILQSTTLIDLGLALAAFVVLGAHLYRARGWPFALVGGSFLLVHAHTYAMELLVGNGHANLAGMLGGHPALKLLQPAVYGVAALYVLALWAATRDDAAAVPTTIQQ